MYIDLFPVNSDWCEVLKIDQKLGIVKNFFSLWVISHTHSVNNLHSTNSNLSASNDRPAAAKAIKRQKSQLIFNNKNFPFSLSAPEIQDL